jgi:hypothetical protein
MVIAGMGPMPDPHEDAALFFVLKFLVSLSSPTLSADLLWAGCVAQSCVFFARTSITLTDLLLSGGGPREA